MSLYTEVEQFQKTLDSIKSKTTQNIELWIKAARAILLFQIKFGFSMKKLEKKVLTRQKRGRYFETVCAKLKPRSKIA